MNYGRHAALTYHAEVGGGFSPALEAGYWVLPKPADMGYLLFTVMDAQKDIASIAPSLPTIADNPALSLLSSLLFAVVMLAIAGYELVKADY
jgi:hypothetical protein